MGYISLPTDGYLNQLLFVEALAVYSKITPESKSMNESAIVAKRDKDFEDMAAYSCSRNKKTFTPNEP